MKTPAKPISISPELAERCDGGDQAERMDAALRAILSTPHSAVMKIRPSENEQGREKKRP